MTEVIVDAAVAARLREVSEKVTLRDGAGSLLGYFIPANKPDAGFVFGVKSPLSPEERERRYREGAADARPLAEFWDEMRQKYPEHFS